MVVYNLSKALSINFDALYCQVLYSAATVGLGGHNAVTVHDRKR